MGIVPGSRPGITEARLREIVGPILKGKGLQEIPPLLLVGIRGYYLDSMGAKGKNDRAIYDDAICVLTEHGLLTFNANTDPSPWRDGVASLATGLHWYKQGNHGISKPGGGYPAFRPATDDESLPVTRDGQTGLSKGVAINIHRGTYNSTSSLGCQTLYPDQWPTFQKYVYAEMKRLKQGRVPYLLIENKGSIS